MKEKDGKLDSLGELAFSLFLTILQLGVNSFYKVQKFIKWIRICGSNNLRDLSINFHLVHFLSIKPMLHSAHVDLKQYPSFISCWADVLVSLKFLSFSRFHFLFYFHVLIMYMFSCWRPYLLTAD